MLYNYYYFNKEKFNNKQKTIIITDTRTDLLGAFTNHLLFVKLYADYHNYDLYISKNSDINNFDGFENQDNITYDNVSNENKHDHKINRKIIVDSLIKKIYNNNVNNCKIININNDTLSIQGKIEEIGLDKVINDKSINNIRKNLLINLPNKNVDTNNLIAIHFRSGEIVNMQDRYIHSSKYKPLLENLQHKYSNHKIIIFTSNLPPKHIDDLSTFNNLEIYSNKPSVLETWRIFIESDVFVMGRSSFSYVPALLRNSNQITYYADFWHPKLKHWETWYNN